MSSESKGNNRRRNNNRGRGGGKGRNRSRSRDRRRGRGRGRSRGESTDKKAPADTTDHTRENAPKEDPWLIGALNNLGHFDPFSVGLAMEVEGEKEVADGQLISLTLWLEDRLIRSWTLDERGKLRTYYWNHINQYLEALECPQDYFPQTPHWRYSASHRQRVVWFLISNATSEVYNEISGQPTSSNPNLVAKTEASVAIAEKEVKSSEIPEEAKCEEKKVEEPLQDNPFPLGFSTGDDEVNRIVMELRMKLLIQLEEDQKAVNEAVCTVQSVTAGRAKPLKQAKLRSHNVSPPKEGRGGRGRGGGRGGRGKGRGGRGRR